jgi:fructose-specific phosphotransferase system component IIB
MKLAIVTACPSGRVSSVLSARLLDAAAQRQGWSTSVEVFDPQHPDQRLSAADIEAADWVLVVLRMHCRTSTVSCSRRPSRLPRMQPHRLQLPLRRARRGWSR